MQKSIEVSFDNLPLIVAEMRDQIYVILDFISEKKKEEIPVPTTPSAQNWLSVKQVAKIIGRSQFTVYTMWNNDEIPFTRYRGRLQFDPIIIEEWLKKQYQDNSNLDIKNSINEWKRRKQKGGHHE